MVSRKRSRSDAVAAPQQQPEEPGLLQRIRSSWEFASLMQYIHIFGKVMKIDEEFEIEVRLLVARYDLSEVRVILRHEFDGFALFCFCSLPVLG